MNDNNEEVIEIDTDHPWVEAAVSMKPQPMPSALQILPVELPPREEGQPNIDAAMITMVTPAGVMTSFMSPASLMGVMQQINDLFGYWEQKAQNGLIVGTPEAMAQAKQTQEVQNLFRKK